MAQIFHPSFKVISRASIVVVVILLGVLSFVVGAMYRSGYMTNQEIPREQPVPFSHEHHYNGLGIQCEYCHTSVDKSSFAGIPPTHTCMTCHSQIWTNAQILQPVRTSYQTGKPLEWIRVHDLPDFVYFNHSIHVAKGVACQVCHGDVNTMPLTWRVKSLQMQWCLECHRAPEKFIRPKADVFNFDYKPPTDQEALGVKLVKEYGIKKKQLTDCSICHR
jgi:Cytochrome c7 and related cytochrome c